MGGCVSRSISLDHSVNEVSQWLEKIGGYTHNLEKNLTALETTMVDLKAKRDDLSRKLKREEDRGLQRLAKFEVWLTRAETIEKEVNDILSARNVELQRLCLCGFYSKSLVSSYHYGKSVFLTLKMVEKLKSEDFDVVADQALTSEVEERQLQPIIVGQETMLDKAWNHFMEDGVGIMGMYGMGGVGKTTLLTQINNKFGKKKCGFDFVIWIVVSKELQMEKIQDEIAQKVGLGGGEMNQKVRLYNFLRKKRFVLFLDDIWEKVDLAEIGVPDPRTQKDVKWHLRLVLRIVNLSNISSEFFKSIPKLSTLDLSFNGNLSVLPAGISNLVSLQYLNLSHTAIQELSKGLQELKKLSHLDLEETPKLCSAGISSLHNLKVLKLFGSTWNLDTVKELKALKHLEILTTIVTNWSPAKEQFLSSHRLMSCTKSLEIRNLEFSGISLPATMDKLRKFNIHGYSISEMKIGRKCSFLSLLEVRIENCKGLKELMFLMFAPNLRVLSVEEANELEDIINKEKACKVENSGVLPFPNLSDLRLVYLQKLKNIYWSPLPFPCLNLIAVASCPNLKKLPLDSKSAKHGENGLIIRYKEKKWIKGVEWEDKATKTRFLSSCEESQDMGDF